MLKKFALDPELFADFSHFLALRDKFGVTQGRLIAKFPSKWKALVREACKRALEEARLKPARANTIMNWMAANGNDAEQPDLKAGGCFFRVEAIVGCGHANRLKHQQREYCSA